MLSCHVCHAGDATLPTPPIIVELNDAPVDPTDHTAVGLQSWGSAIVFAQRMCLDSERYLGASHPCTRTTSTKTETETCLPPRPRRVLELGAGTGLLSITAAQIFSRTTVQVEVKATDYHPSVLENLARNVRHNHSAVGVSVEKLDWCAVTRTGGGGVYDVVLAADVVYHPEHARWIRECVERTLDKCGVFWLVIPMRSIGRHEGLSSTVEEAFPFADERGGSEERLGVVRREEVERMDGVGRADEGGYTLFEIRWTGFVHPSVWELHK
ncbi:hypothetical protein JVT61DRAFT_5020 [Boletus reticuloceps]|uniref:Uncharacterized protein n=1 Tax=Boletus reticuloceps TaxID=495285 RepID=A0A8I2YXQ8_9AGAM|nr:hypothetical protein JVT61DRAFT_5020 [Boletus reticuloceps]